MRVAILLALLPFALDGCNNDAPRSSGDDPNSRGNQRDVSNSDSPSTISYDPFISGESYRLALKVAEVTPGLEKSSAVVRVAVGNISSNGAEEDTSTENNCVEEDTSTENNGVEEDTSTENNGVEEDTEDENTIDDSVCDDEVFVSSAKVRLDWECGEQQRGHEEVEIRDIDFMLNVKLGELPALRLVSDSIHCKVNASLDTERINGERVIATGNGEFYIEMDVFYPALKLHKLTTAADQDDPASTVVDFKVALIREGKPVVQGDVVFDTEVDVELRWSCVVNNCVCRSESECREECVRESDIATEMSIDAGKSEAEAQLKIPLRPSFGAEADAVGEAGYACMIDASSDIDGFPVTARGSKKLWVEGKDLQVAVTAVSSSSLTYAVMQRYQKLSSNVRLSLANCGGVTLNDGISDVSSITLASSGDITLSGVGGGCELIAEVLATDGAVVRRGKSNLFTVPN